ncbi:hypothetical protein CGJ21_04830 [Vibrio parahaemolyticus]|uniref:SMP-30/gluconolactonase/LRE family protein n=1 Tax=Vibrio parahaemolyticus TaxID=670 RepID=UPI00112386FD|nr:SMP-30/gluconolactonase/LRE family protein [Vibrio parahaemolyticus]TOF41922.1 hypothetical protein CGJ23_01125 [Vibrio parahaemolyticus]TOF50431.1 hypothetical protein CGJ21_04830 [Vibrio parahaemolyticus]HCG5236622.1 SMP-30/gluconolactonase/LRE family protein [Vibrio parahaemolyticus]HCG7072773.1 SMP-30/gluconolactonase/LRE family protein [Vibrio parahaemolyticus]
MKKINCIPMDMELGEGPIWNRNRQSWCWFDILNSTLYELPFGESTPELHQLPMMVSAMATLGANGLLLASETNIASYDLVSKELHEVIKLGLPSDMRTNDGGMGFDGRFWFSTMQKSPSEAKGAIYSLSPNFTLKKHIDGIVIPNTMVWDTKMSGLMLSDSFYQQTYLYPYEGEQFKPDKLSNPTIDLKHTSSTPDGGALDINGNMWVALWGGHKVICVDPLGEIIDEIDLPVPQPSSCCFGGEHYNHLIITSAKEGLTKADLDKYPLSGSVFIVDLDVEGIAIPGFLPEKTC